MRLSCRRVERHRAGDGARAGAARRARRHGRPQRLRGARGQGGILAKIPGAKVDVLELDLSSMASVRRFAADFESLNLPLNILMSFSSNKPLTGEHEEYM
ncbi:hypothetical protein ACP70R_020925 [Stipagrostis hirtigluma subsp. patula]